VLALQPLDQLRQAQRQEARERAEGPPRAAPDFWLLRRNNLD